MDKLRSVEGREGTTAITPEPNTVAWAHVSDFHFKANQDHGRDEVLRHALLRDLEMVSGQRAPERGVEPIALDFVVVTGDVAYSGQREEYDAARRFFEELSKAALVPCERIFVVPGNHDVDRDRDVTEDAVVSGPDGLERFWRKLAKRRAISHEKLAAYRTFAAALNPNLRSPEEQPGGFAHVLDVRGRKIALLGLSSCWLSGKDGEQGRLLVGKSQAYDLAGGAGFTRMQDADLKLALLHHPLAWLQEFDQGDLEGLLAEHVDVVLHGHLHKTGLTLQSTPGRVLRMIAAGAAYAGSQYPNAYNIARATLGGAHTIDFWLREYVPASRCFVADNRTYPQAEGGRWTWTLTGATHAAPRETARPMDDTAAIQGRYFAALRAATRCLPKDTSGTIIELTRVYTHLSVIVAAEQAAEQPGGARDKRSPAGAVGDVARTESELKDLLGRYPHLILVGDPGAGKTTFLQFTALNLARAWLDDERDASLASLGWTGDLPFPVLCRLGEFGQFLENDAADACPPKAAERFYRYLEYLCRGFAPHLPPAFLKRRVLDGGAILLLDGLDEVSGDDRRQQVSAIIDEVVTQGIPRGNRHLVTCRTRPYEGLVQLGREFVRALLLDFGSRQVEDFVRHWFVAQGSNDRGQSDGADRFLADLKAHPHVRPLTANPLLLTILAAVHADGARLPERRADLYEKALSRLLRSRQSASTRSLEQRRWCLRALALRMFETLGGPRAMLDRADAARVVAPVLKESVPEALRFVEQEELNSGILVYRRRGEVEFWHPTFGEYLAAEALAMEWLESAEPVWKRLCPHLYDERWSEVILLLAGALRGLGRDEARDFLQRILAQPGDLVAQGRAVGLVGRILQDIDREGDAVAVGTAYAEALKRTLAIFERDSKVSEKVRIEVGEALGQAGDPRIHEDDLLNRTQIEGGTFLMGAQSKNPKARGYDAEAFDDEGPPHEVSLSPFWIDRYLVTVAKFRRFVEAGREGYLSEELWSEAGWAWRVKAAREVPGGWQDQLAHSNRPVRWVSWYEASAYCAWLTSRHRGWRVALPTEAQWEFAARGRVGRKYPWGPEAPSEAHASFAGRTDAPTPVGIYPLGATPEGVHDLAGNVWEWCADWFGDYRPVGEADPVGPPDGTSRVLRGGAFRNGPRSLRAASRLSVAPENDHNGVGFRCVWVEAGRTE